MEWGDVGEFIGVAEHSATGLIRSRGAVSELAMAV